MRTRHVVGLLVITLIIGRPVQARWESARDDKSPVELAQMTNEELFNETFDVCVRRALLESLPNPVDETRQALTECNDYLSVVSPFVRERNGGQVPPWMTELVTAHTTRECQRGFQAYLGKPARAAAASAREDTAEAPEPGPTVVRKARRPRSHWSEQLPPWLAPP